MIYFSKSPTAPTSLSIEKAKDSGTYRKDDVITRLENDFKNKCYICEIKSATCLNVEHFRPHKGNIDLKFDWNNLFLSCSHCNNQKHDSFENIGDCTDIGSELDKKIRYEFNPFPMEKPTFTPLVSTVEIQETVALLEKVFNGVNTPLKKLEGHNLRTALLQEIRQFQDLLIDYFIDSDSEEKIELLPKIKKSLNKSSAFTAFKRWIVWNNEHYKNEFEEHINN